MYHDYYIPLNKTSLLLFEPNYPSSEPQLVVVQVRVKPACENIIDELVVFYLNQSDITKAIEILIEAHISTQPCSEVGLRRCVEIEVEGNEYVLHATRKPWTFGQYLTIEAGDTIMQKAQDKWTITVHYRRRS